MSSSTVLENGGGAQERKQQSEQLVGACFRRTARPFTSPVHTVGLDTLCSFSMCSNSRFQRSVQQIELEGHELNILHQYNTYQEPGSIICCLSLYVLCHIKNWRVKTTGVFTIIAGTFAALFVYLIETWRRLCCR